MAVVEIRANSTLTVLPPPPPLPALSFSNLCLAGIRGWEYSSSFQPQAVFTSCYRVDSVVRRRRWQRVRRFLGHDRWLLCSVSQADLDPLKSDSRRSSGSNAVHVHKLVLG
ncbi:hypothetical protein ACTXT7_015602, partial [Hymenolepis weldensis]